MLDSGPYLEALDAATVQLAPGAPVPSLSWPGLAHVLTKYIAEDVKASGTKKKGPDAALGKGFRLLVARAEEGARRCGAGRLLTRRAPTLFKHVADVLDAVGLSSPIGSDYSHALRNQLLAVPEYCAPAPPSAFQGALRRAGAGSAGPRPGVALRFFCAAARGLAGTLGRLQPHAPLINQASILTWLMPHLAHPIPAELVGIHLDFLDKHGLERGGEEVQRALATLAALLASYPGDVSPLLQVRGREVGQGRAAKPACRGAAGGVHGGWRWWPHTTHRSRLTYPPQSTQTDILDCFRSLVERLLALAETAPRCRRDADAGVFTLVALCHPAQALLQKETHTKRMFNPPPPRCGIPAAR